MADMQKQYITPETKQKLEDELNALIAHRPVVAAEINERREEGDLKENAGYDAAREMQDQEEARIKQISEILANSTTERSGIEEGVAHIGSVVHVYYNGDEGDTREYTAPNGVTNTVTILSAEPYNSEKAATPRAAS